MGPDRKGTNLVRAANQRTETTLGEMRARSEPNGPASSNQTGRQDNAERRFLESPGDPRGVEPIRDQQEPVGSDVTASDTAGMNYADASPWRRHRSRSWREVKVGSRC